LVFPGTAVDGTAFDFLEVDTVFSEGFKGSEQSAGAMCEAHGDGHFVRVGWRRLRFVDRTKEKEASEIFSIVLDVGGKDDAGVVFGGASAGDGGGGFVAAGQDLANATGGVFGGDTFEVGMRGEETFTLG